MIVDEYYIRCPKCGWEPDEHFLWICDECHTKWNTFKTHGKCPNCNKKFIDTQCSKSKGGCGQMSLNANWYEPIERVKSKPKEKFVWFWQGKKDLSITEAEKKWVENALLTLAEVFGKDYFRSITTITPDKKNFDREFDGTEADAEFIIERLISMMQIDSSEIKLMFFSNPSNLYSGGLVTINLPKSNSLVNTAGLYVDIGTTPKEIWIETSLLKNTIGLTKTLAHELTHFKLLGERRRLVENDEYLTDLTAIGFGFGIFFGNARSYLQEPVIAYALAWLAHYRNEDISWIHYLNKPVKKYFMRSYKYIERNNDLIKWKLDS